MNTIQQCPGAAEGQWCPGLDQELRGQQDRGRGSDHPSVLRTEATAGVLCMDEGTGLLQSGEEVAQRGPCHSGSPQKEGTASEGQSFPTDNK